jgi:hypothetical protein
MAKKDLIVGEIGDNFSRLFLKINFDSHQSLLDFDLIFLDLNHISNDLYHSGGNSDPCFAETINVSESKRSILEKRGQELKEYVQEGRILVIFLPKPQTYKFMDGRHYTEDTFLNTALSPTYLLLDSIQGTEIDIMTKTRFTKFIDKFKHILYYKSSFKKKATVGMPIAKIKGTDKVIASVMDNVLFLPSIKPLHYDGQVQEINSFGDELVELLIPTNPDYSLPKWAENYLLSGEEDLLTKKDEELKKFEQIEKEVKKIDSTLFELNKQKVLLTGSGDPLEITVSNIFKQLGVTILESETNRDDLIFEYKGKVAVVEIKGITKSATEEHAMQLEKWVTEYAIEKKITPKGILIVNTFRELELSKRTGIDFPDQMKKFSLKRDHCLMTTLQLLGLYYDCMIRPKEKDSIINLLFETVGEFGSYTDWSKFIKMK